MVVLESVIAYFLVWGFIGYVIGRFGDNYLNFWIGDPAYLPDHWIYGVLLMIAGLYFFTNTTGLYIFSFGLGHYISDFKDFWNMKFYGKDNKEKGKVRFWHID